MSGSRSLDLNADVGEGAGSDAELVPLVSSVNIACGAHAGDDATMRETVALAMRHGVALGAHPGFADREHFGRRELPLAPGEAATLVLGQVAALKGVVQTAGGRLSHVKLHGALYNMAARDLRLASEVVRALAANYPHLKLLALAGSILVREGRARGLEVVGEAFADRSYRVDGSLTPRSEPGALIADPEASVRQVLDIATRRGVRASDGSWVAIDAGTVCLHGDGAHAVDLARRIRAALAESGISARA